MEPENQWSYYPWQPWERSTVGGGVVLYNIGYQETPPAGDNLSVMLVGRPGQTRVGDRIQRGHASGRNHIIGLVLRNKHRYPEPEMAT